MFARVGRAFRPVGNAGDALSPPAQLMIGAVLYCSATVIPGGSTRWPGPRIQCNLSDAEENRATHLNPDYACPKRAVPWTSDADRHRRSSACAADDEGVEVPNVPIQGRLLHEGEPKLPTDVLGGAVGWVDYRKQFARKRLTSAGK